MVYRELLHSSRLSHRSDGRPAGQPRRWRQRPAADSRWVRPPRPWRALKVCGSGRGRGTLSGDRVSGFIPRHMEQPAYRHSAPAAMNTSCSPSFGRGAHRVRARHHEHPHPVCDLAAPDHLSGSPQVSRRPLVQEPTNTTSMGNSRMGVPGVERHVGQRPFGGGALGTGGELRWVPGTTPSNGTPCPGCVPRSRTARLAGVQDFGVERGARIGGEATPVVQRRLPLLAEWRVSPSSRKAKVVSSGATMPALAPHSMDMFATVIRPSMDMCPDGLTAVLHHVTASTAGADLGDQREDQVLGGHSFLELAGDVDRHGLQSVLGQRRVAQYVFHLTGADSKASAPNAPWVEV